VVISMLVSACLLGDPDPMAEPSALADSAIGRAAASSFDASAFAMAVPRVDPIATPDILGNDGKATFSYSYAEAGYEAMKLDEPDKTAHAIFVRASLGFLDYFHVFAAADRASTSFDNATADNYQVGGGVHLPILSRLDLIGEAAWLYDYIDSDHLFDKDTNTGVSLYAGARFMVLDWSGGGLELNGGYRYTDITSLLSDKVNSAIEVGARFHFLNHLSVGATYAFIDQDRSLAVDLRFSF
jgi:opacity protein-like surface antigen